jgi:hypothetical protein
VYSRAIDKKVPVAAVASKDKLNETRAVSKVMENAAIALLTSLNYMPLTHTKPVCRCVLFVVLTLLVNYKWMEFNCNLK